MQNFVVAELDPNDPFSIFIYYKIFKKMKSKLSIGLKVRGSTVESSNQEALQS